MLRVRLASQTWFVKPEQTCCAAKLLQVAVVVNVTAYIDFKKQSLFSSLRDTVTASNKKTVIRNGETVTHGIPPPTYTLLIFDHVMD